VQGIKAIRKAKQEASMQVSTGTLQESLTPQTLRPLQIIYGAMIAGVTVFTIFVVMYHYFFASPADARHGIDTYTQILVWTTMLYTVGALAGGHFFYQQRLRSATRMETAAGVLITFRSALLIRIAAIEGAALLGAVVCFIASNNGSLRAHPDFWITLVPYLIFLLIAYISFPTKRFLLQLFETQIRKGDSR
jgi:hypothetical protein